MIFSFQLYGPLDVIQTDKMKIGWCVPALRAILVTIIVATQITSRFSVDSNKLQLREKKKPS